MQLNPWLGAAIAKRLKEFNSRMLAVAGIVSLCSFCNCTLEGDCMAFSSQTVQPIVVQHRLSPPRQHRVLEMFGENTKRRAKQRIENEDRGSNNKILGVGFGVIPRRPSQWGRAGAECASAQYGLQLRGRSVDVDGRTESVLMRLLGWLNRLMCDRHHVMMRGTDSQVPDVGASRLMSDEVSTTYAITTRALLHLCNLSLIRRAP
jgi:hypothetical protein